MMRLRQIDDLALPDHYHLTSADQCWYITEYTAGRKFNYSDGNRLICDLQIGVEQVKVDSGWRNKKQIAIDKAAELLLSILTKDQLLKPTWVPVPPSKSKAHATHDSRVLDVLNALKAMEPGLDVRELIDQAGDREPAKKSTAKRDVDALYKGYQLNASAKQPPPKLLIVFDDVVTTGASFRAMDRRLREEFPGIRVVGVFLARRILQPPQDGAGT